MRRRAQSTLNEIEIEQSRLREKISTLPDVTRASADSMRVSLQEQLKALDQLSSLSNREAQRSDISPPMTLMPAEPAPQQPSRTISSLTQTLANEMSTRGRAPYQPPAQSASLPQIQYKTSPPPSPPSGPISMI